MSGLTRYVVVGVDGSEPALEAVRWAAVEAARRGVTLRLVGATPLPLHRGIGARGPHIDYTKAFVELVGIQLDAAAEVALGHASGLDIEQQAVIGFPAPVLESESKRAELLILGSRGLGGVSGMLLGSVAVAMTTHAHCPVVIVRGEQPDVIHPLLPVVAGVDGSTASEAATGFAFEIAAAREVPLVAVRAWQDPSPDLAGQPRRHTVEAEADQRAILDEHLAGWTEKFPSVEVRSTVAHDHPARLLLRHAASAQLIAVGSRGRTPFAGLVLGSVSHALVHHAPCPVAVFRPGPTAH